MSELSNQLPTEPISAVGVVTSLNKVPDGYYVVSMLLLWKHILKFNKIGFTPNCVKATGEIKSK